MYKKIAVTQLSDDNKIDFARHVYSMVKSLKQLMPNRELTNAYRNQILTRSKTPSTTETTKIFKCIEDNFELIKKEINLREESIEIPQLAINACHHSIPENCRKYTKTINRLEEETITSFLRGEGLLKKAKPQDCRTLEELKTLQRTRKRPQKKPTNYFHNLVTFWKNQGKQTVQTAQRKVLKLDLSNLENTVRHLVDFWKKSSKGLKKINPNTSKD